jgi:very-short-patch-repair endonuclease
MDKLLDINNKIKPKTWNYKKNHIIYAEWLGKELGYTKKEDWYNITKKHFTENKGGGLLNTHYNNSPIQFLKKIFPDYEWLDFKLGRTPTHYWENIDNHKKYAEWLGKELGYTKEEDWYNISISEFEKKYGNGLLYNYYNSSPIQFVKTIFSNYEWLEWKFNKTQQHYWENIDNHKKYAEWLGKELGYTTYEHWYNITEKQIIEKDGQQCLSKYNNSPINFVKIIFPDYKWLEWKFIQTSKKYWDIVNNHRIYAEWLGKELGYIKEEDWYNITYNIIEKHKGGGLLSKYNQSPIHFLKFIFPNYEWLEWKFGMASLGTWQDINNHIKYAEWLGKELGYIKEEDWYNISQNHFNLNNGGGLIAGYYNSSPIQFVKTIFPNYEWLEWKFIQTSKHYWENIDNHKKYAEWLGKELGYTEPEHWYNISGASIKNNYGGTVINYYNGSPSQFIITIFNHYDWDEKKFCKYKTEIKLYEQILKKYTSLIRQFKQDWCKNIFHLPFDFCIPEHNIIIELDGAQHFRQISNWSSPEEQFKNDKYKEKCANDNGYLIIRILQEDVLDDVYKWEDELIESIEKIKNGHTKNIYLCKNDEYTNFIS